MKDFAGSSITYYGLAREKLSNKYPWLASFLIILALICMTGLAMYLLSDLFSFASNSNYKGANIGLDLNVPENGIYSMGNNEEKSGNIATNSSLNTSRQTKEQSSANLSKTNSSLSSAQAANGVIATGKSSSSSSQSSIDKKSGNSPSTRSRSSSSSSSKSSSANSAKTSGDMNNLTNETVTVTLPANETVTVTLPANETVTATLPTSETVTVTLPTDQIISSSQAVSNDTIAGISNLSSEEQSGILSEDESSAPQVAEVATTAALSSSPSTSIRNLVDPAGNTPAREPASMIQFKTETKLSPKSELEANPESGASANGVSVSDNADNMKSSKAPTKNIKFKTTKTKSTPTRESKVTASSQGARAKEAREKIKANKDRIDQMKKKAALSRSKPA